MKAARAGHLCTVQFLISRGADVNKQTTNNDHTPLSLACAGGHLNVVEVLLQQGVAEAQCGECGVMVTLGTVKVHFEGWSDRHDAVFKKNSNKMAPFRSQTAGYTGQRS